MIACGGQRLKQFEDVGWISFSNFWRLWLTADWETLKVFAAEMTLFLENTW